MQYSTSEKHYLIAASCLSEVGPVTLKKIMSANLNREIDISDICRFSVSEFRNELEIGTRAAKQLAGVSSPLERGEDIQNTLESRGVCVIFDDSDSYPPSLKKHLGRDAPPLLFVAGACELLRTACIGVVGSRRPSGPAAEAARLFSKRLAAHGWTVVSGAAAGIDSCGHAGAMTSGKTVIMPPEGIFRFKWHRALREKLDEGNWCLVSQFPPDSGWETRHALIRNKMITALSEAVVAFEPRDRGGTWHSSNMALKMRKPLFVASNRTDHAHNGGMKKLLRRGAQPLDCSEMPSIGEFEALLLGFEAPSPGGTKTLFGETRRHGDEIPEA